MKKCFALLAIVAVAYGVIGTLGKDVTAAPALAVNWGRDGLSCNLIGAFSGTGRETFVANSGGRINLTCSGFINEPPPSRTLVFSIDGPLGTVCGIVITPSGNFSASCH